MKKILIFGSFDILHPGHYSLIEEAKRRGETHVVLALDETIQKVKGRPPYHSLATRRAALERLGIIVHDGDRHDKLKAVKELKPDVFLLGYDQLAFVDLLEEYVGQFHARAVIERAGPLRETIFKSSAIRRSFEDPTARFVLVDKPSGENSMRSIAILRRLTGIKRIGFSGTLDPLASGLLPCGIGGAAGMLDWWHELPKTYEAQIRLGSISTTDDAGGERTTVSDRVPGKAELEKALEPFSGEIIQTPPQYSAKKIEGVRAYRHARRGVTKELKPVTVRVYSMQLLSYEYPSLTLRIRCGTGTYIRAIARDLGASLQTGAYIEDLRRTAIGSFPVEIALRLSEATSEDDLKKAIISPDELRVAVLREWFPDSARTAA